MDRFIRASILTLILTMVAISMLNSNSAEAASAAQIDRDVNSALMELYESNPSAKELATVAKAVLVFPRIVKAGFVVGAQRGVGALRVKGKTVGYYKTFSASYGLQAGVQAFGYALFFMTDSALDYLKKSGGWEIGVGPSIVIVDQGMARSLTTTTAKDDIYAFVFSQQGLMAGLGLQGTKITRIHPK